jgi:hypothetical protein
LLIVTPNELHKDHNLLCEPMGVPDLRGPIAYSGTWADTPIPISDYWTATGHPECQRILAKTPRMQTKNLIYLMSGFGEIFYHPSSPRVNRRESPLWT